MAQVNIKVASDFFSFEETVNESVAVKRLTEIRKIYEQANDHFVIMQQKLKADGNLHDYVHIDGKQKLRVEIQKL